jgi:hypothetical protein
MPRYDAMIRSSRSRDMDQALAADSMPRAIDHFKRIDGRLGGLARPSRVQAALPERAARNGSGVI